MKLNHVSSIAATAEAGVYLVRCNLTDMNKETYDAEYCSRPEDTFGLNPTIRKWLTDNPTFPIDPYVPPPAPTPDQIRAKMPKLSARQLRMGLVGGGFQLSTVSDAIDAIADPTVRELSRIEWEYATEFNRLNPLLLQVGAQLGLSPDQIDAMWMASKDL